MNAHPRHLPIELDGFLIIDMEDPYHPAFAKTEAEAKVVYRKWPGDASLCVIRMADGRHHPVTVDFIPNEDEGEERPINRIAFLRHIGAVERA